jgi:hypothetical protein
MTAGNENVKLRFGNDSALFGMRRGAFGKNLTCFMSNDVEARQRGNSLDVVSDEFCFRSFAAYFLHTE